MRVIDVTMAGWKPFTGEVRLDLATLPGVITAVCGPNGAGKTTLTALGTLVPFYRMMPEQRPDALATERASYVRTTVELARGERLGITHTFDAKNGGGTVKIEDAAGRVLDDVKSGGIKEFKKWAARRLPDVEVITAGPHLAQGDGGILALGDTDRGRVILRAMGADRVVREAKCARDKAREVAAELGKAVARLGDERERSGDVASARAALDAAVLAREAAKGALAGAQAALAAAQAREAADGRLTAAQKRAAELAARTAGDRAIAARSAEIRDAAERSRAIGADLADLEAAVDAAGRARDDAAARVRRAEGDLADAQRRRADEHGALTRAVEAEAATLARANERANAAVNRARAPREVLADGANIRAAAARLVELDAAIAAGQVDLLAARTEVERTSHALVLAASRQRAGSLAADTAELAMVETHQRVKWLGNVDQCVAELPEARAAVEAERARAERTAASVEALREDGVSALARRHAALLAAVRFVIAASEPTTAEDALRSCANARSVAGAAVDRDEQIAEEAASLPARTEAAWAAHRAAALALGQAEERFQAAESTAARAGELAMAREAHAKAVAARDAARSEVEQASTDAVTATAAHQGAVARAGEAEATLAALRTERESVAPLASLVHALAGAAAQLAQAEADEAEAEAEVRAARLRVKEAKKTEDLAYGDYMARCGALTDAVEDAQQERAQAGQRHAEAAARALACREQTTRREAALAEEAALTRAEAALAAVASDMEAAETELAAARVALAELPETLTAAVAEVALKAATAALEVAVTAAARAEDAHARAEAGAARMAELEAQRAALEVDLAEWRELAEDLGRNGLQADLVDQAAPTLTARANGLLRDANITRWSLRFDTQGTDADGDAVPGFPLYVRDELTGVEREARTFSHGEQVLLGAAAANAVTVLACERADIVAPVLVRDETGAALDPEREMAWLTMLRKTAELTGASRVLVVTHSDRVRERCDSVIWVRDGKVTVGDADPVEGGPTVAA